MTSIGLERRLAVKRKEVPILGLVSEAMSVRCRASFPSNGSAVAIAASDICVLSFSLIGRLSQVMQLTKIISESVKKLPTAPRVDR